MGFWDNYWREDNDPEKPRPEIGTPEDLGDVFNWEFWLVGLPLLIVVIGVIWASLGGFS